MARKQVPAPAPLAMTPARVDAIVASAFNLLAALEPAGQEPSRRAQFPNGMRPADAAKMEARQKAVLLTWYANNADERTSLYTRAEALRAAGTL